MRFEKCTLQEAMRAYADIYKKIPDCRTTKDKLDALMLPERSTEGSAGYDFRSPFDFKLNIGDTITIPLYVKAVDMPEDVVLLIYNRSGTSLKKGLRLDNAVGVIDSDFERCIVFQATATRPIEVKFNDRICQGIFHYVAFVDGDGPKAKKKGKKRVGGLGSTGEE